MLRHGEVKVLERHSMQVFDDLSLVLLNRSIPFLAGEIGGWLRDDGAHASTSSTRTSRLLGEISDGRVMPSDMRTEKPRRR